MLCTGQRGGQAAGHEKQKLALTACWALAGAVHEACPAYQAIALLIDSWQSYEQRLLRGGASARVEATGSGRKRPVASSSSSSGRRMDSGRQAERCSADSALDLLATGKLVVNVPCQSEPRAPSSSPELAAKPSLTAGRKVVQVSARVLT